MARQLMPKSGIMMPYVVVSRDAAVVGVSTVDGLAGAIDLTKKYMKITDADDKYAVKSNVYTKTEVQGLLSPIMEGALFKDDPFVNNNVAIRSGGGNNVESVDMIKVSPENEIIIGDYSSGVQGVKIHTSGQLELIDTDDDGGAERVDKVYSTAHRPETSQVPFAAIGSYVLDSQGRTIGVNKTGVNSDIKQLTGLTTPISIGQGGTGSLTVKGARDNLQAMYRSQSSLETTDLNTLNSAASGFYYQTMTANATSERNYPSQEAGGLYVYQTGANGGASCIQEYVGFESRRKYIRSLNGATWTAWLEYASTGNHNTFEGMNTFNNQVTFYNNVPTIIKAGEGLRLVSPSDSGCYIVGHSANTSNQSGRRWFVGNSTAENSVTLYNYKVNNSLILNSGGAIVLSARSNGTGSGNQVNTNFNASGTIVGPQGTVQQVASDARLKSSIELARAGALDRINAIGCVEFTWDCDNRRDRGFIAQQLAEVDELYTYKPTEDGYLNYSMTALMSDTFGAIQELTKINKAQQDQIDELKALVQQLLEGKQEVGG